MGIAFPGESREYRAARDRLLEQEIELRRAMEAVAAARRELPPGGAVPEDYVFQGGGQPGRADRCEAFGAVRAGQELAGDLQLHVPARPRRPTPGPAERAVGALAARGGPLPVVRRAARPARRRRRACEPAPQPRGRREGAAARACSPSARSVAGGSCGCCPRPPTPTTATTSPRPRTGHRGRCSTCSTATARRSATSGARSSSTRRPDPGQEPRHVGTLEPLWNLFDLTPEGRPSDWDEQLSYS